MSRGCRFADLKKGVVDFSQYVAKTNPEVVIFDISPPYVENWAFYKTLCELRRWRAAASS